MTAVLDAERLSVGYRRLRRTSHVVAADLEFGVDEGEFVCLLGPNGAGKSTLLRTLAGLQPALEGTVRLRGAELRSLSREERARTLAIVLTERIVSGLMTARGVVQLGRHPHTGWSGRLAPADTAIVDAAMETVGASPWASRPIAELSDGERQRVMIARALAQEPRVLLLDEPTAFLDAPRRIELFGLLRTLARERGIGVVASTHDVEPVGLEPTRDGLKVRCSATELRARSHLTPRPARLSSPAPRATSTSEVARRAEHPVRARLAPARRPAT